ncbi:MAG: Acetyl-CoA carboxylase, biotin carboxyl carrier protein [Leptospirillum sp. Group IV 'UBA BS']|nr:MAG: Acetyl-CoA carboxylase, biotin carboxyl carrier protein [Leptospirillum sp. Group IV 'UBA BS']
MNNEDIREILELVREHNLLSFEFERDGARLRIQRSPFQGSFQAVSEPFELPLPGSGPPAPSSTQVARPESVRIITSPIVGTFYRSSSPDAAPYVEVGSTVSKGQILCIIEAMKLMNEIESEIEGTVRAFLVENGQPVEYGTPLLEIDTKAEETS